MEFIDYYSVLGVARSATADEIDRAYRKLARQFHPDVSKAKNAEEKFKQVGEAYEVLKDSAKRAQYDQYGAAWKDAQEHGAPPPGFDGFRAGRGRAGPGTGGFSTEFGAGGDFSDFFQQLFGMGGGLRGGAADSPFGGSTRGGRQTRRSQGRVATAGFDQEARINLSLEDAAHGGRREVTIREPETGATRKLALQVPRGVRAGQRIRLAGQGSAGHGGAPGHLYLQVDIAPHPLFRLEGADLHTVLPVAPWTATLGGTALLCTLDGNVKVKVPAGTSSGRRIWLAGRGFPNGHGAGDLYAEIRVHVPENLTPEERELFEKLATASAFVPPSQHA